MRVLKLKLFQESACYRKPFSYKAWESYPLPTYSMVKGLMHKLLDADTFIPMAISVQGDYESVYTNYQTFRLYKKATITTMPFPITELFNVNLVIHVASNEDIIERLYKTLSNVHEFLSLGRHEDIMRIDDVKIVDLKDHDADDDSITLRYNTYIPVSWAKSNMDTLIKMGIRYKFGYIYEYVNNSRIWTMNADVLYVERGTLINEGLLEIDEEGGITFLWPMEILE